MMCLEKIAASWNARNQLVSISGNVTASFVYDALGRRISKTINGARTDYQYDGNDIIAEISGGVVTATYIRSLNIDEPFVRTSSGGVENYLADGLGSIIALTDVNGNQTVTYTYDPFGNTIQTGISGNPFQYTGRENDGTGLLYYRARYYSPTLQRFVSEDPLVCQRNKGVNLYAYVTDNPLNFTDPSGLLQGGGTKDTCKYYDDLCKKNNSKSSDAPDKYACKAGDCCRAFSENITDRCVRQCLISNDADCSQLPEPSRTSCRKGTHAICYFTCIKLPINIPQECSGILWP